MKINAVLKKLLLFILLLGLVSCKDHSKESDVIKQPMAVSEFKYAKGFSISQHETFKVLNIKHPWPKSEKTYKYALVPKENLASLTLDKTAFDGIITTPIKRIVVTSTTHIPALELLEETQSLVGFPGTDYVSSKKVRELIDKAMIRELGKNEGINTEVLLELKPEVVIGFGIDGNNRTFENIQKSGIPVIYNGDWVENSPLAKAEWIKLFGALYNKSQQADSVFNKIESAYLSVKQLAAKLDHKPTVLSGALEKDVWYLPSSTSPEAQLLKDANVNYLWQDVTGKGSLALSFEAVYTKAKDADLWLSPSYHNSLEALKKANEHYTQFKPYKNKTIYSFVNTTGKTGGVTYYEEGTARPDLVLKDLVKICHPNVLPEYEPYFFKPLK